MGNLCQSYRASLAIWDPVPTFSLLQPGAQETCSSNEWSRYCNVICATDW